MTDPPWPPGLLSMTWSHWTGEDLAGGQRYPHLCRSTVYQVVVSASNRHGWSDQSELFTFSTRDTGDLLTSFLSSQHLAFQITHSSNPGASLVSYRIDFSLHIPEKMRRNQLNIFSDFHSSGSKAECGWWWSVLLLTCTLVWGMGGSKGRCAMGTGMFWCKLAPKAWLQKFASLDTGRSRHLDVFADRFILDGC